VTLKATEPSVIARIYPHVDEIADWRAQQSVRLLWDRVAALEARLQGVEATQGDLVAASNRHQDQLVRVDRKADETLALVQGVEGEPWAGSGGGGGGGGGSGALIWAWVDRSGPTVDSPYATGPQTSDEYRDYFYGLISRTLGEAADDWVQVLTDSGIPTGLDAGVPPDDTMPFFALTQQIGAGGVRGRLFLPTSTPDGLGYYAHPFDVLADA
jgi:hypothetical protein